PREAQLLLDLAERVHDVVEVRLRPRLRVERSLRLEVDALDVAELEALLPDCGDELLLRHQLVPEVLLLDVTVFVENGARSVQHPAEPRELVAQADEEAVPDKEDRCTQQAARERRLVPDDRVLHDVREQEEDDEVERAHLRELALPGEPKQDEQAEVHDERADDLVPPGKAEVNEVVVHRSGIRRRRLDSGLCTSLPRSSPSLAPP